MQSGFVKLLEGYQSFRKKYAHGDMSVMRFLSHYGQQPQVMVVSCCDSRVDPALILQCDPGDLFVVRNVANIIPPYEIDEAHHGTSAALEFGICMLKVKHLVLLGHSQCGGIQSLFDNNPPQNDFLSNWVALIQNARVQTKTPDDCAKLALDQSYQNCLTFPWINEKIKQQELTIHRWFFDIKTGQIFTHSDPGVDYQPLEI